MKRLKFIIQYSYLFFRSLIRIKRPVVINAWVQFPRNGSDQSFCGLGDLLRGVCFLHQLSQRFRFEFQVDFRGHQLSRFLEVRPHPYDSIVDQRIGKIEFKSFNESLSAARYIEDAYESDHVVTLMTNGTRRTFSDSNFLSANAKKFARECFRIKKDYMTLIEERLPDQPYDILHVRLGDSFLVDNSSLILNEAFHGLYDYLSPYMKSNTLFITDSYLFKWFVIDRNPEISFIQGMPVHIGLETSEEELMDTLTEFVALQRASVIHTYSIYSWESGFAKSAAILYDVPLIRIPRIAPWINGQLPVSS